MSCHCLLCSPLHAFCATSHCCSRCLPCRALNLIGSDTLWGRNWGCAPNRDFPLLHFEVDQCIVQASARAAPCCPTLALPLQWPSPPSSLSSDLYLPASGCSCATIRPWSMPLNTGWQGWRRGRKESTRCRYVSFALSVSEAQLLKG